MIMYITSPMQAHESNVFCCAYASPKQKAVLLIPCLLIRPPVVTGKGENMLPCSMQTLPPGLLRYTNF